MIACTDVHYGKTQAIAACLLFRDWPDDYPCLEVTERIEQPLPYEPGRFYRRELPGLLSVIGKLVERPGVIVIDGYVWLGDEFHPGLGHIFTKLLAEMLQSSAWRNHSSKKVRRSEPSSAGQA
jgi:deoxyribonuclease V